jgi:hypothetical protein
MFELFLHTLSKQKHPEQMMLRAFGVFYRLRSKALLFDFDLLFAVGIDGFLFTAPESAITSNRFLRYNFRVPCGETHNMFAVGALDFHRAVPVALAQEFVTRRTAHVDHQARATAA